MHDRQGPLRPTGPAVLWTALGDTMPIHRRRSARSGDRLARAGEAIGELWFPLDALILIVRQTPLDPVPLTVGLIGPEGFAGGAALLDIDHWTHDVVALRGGEFVAVPIDAMHDAIAETPELAKRLRRVIHNQMLQLAQSVVANLGHSLERRLARWLVMLHDRGAGDAIRVTHGQLAQLLNVRRASVTDALHVLEGERLVRAARGVVAVRDRAGLQARAGQSYGLSEGDYHTHVGPFGKALTAPAG